MALEVAETMHLIWIAVGKSDRYLDNLCRSWHDALDDFIYVPVDAEISDRIVDINSHIFKVLNNMPDNLDHYDFYISGNQSIVNSFNKALLDNGLPATQLALDSITHD